jgi:RNA polymerase sigma-70 factor, ECF subfamily
MTADEVTRIRNPATPDNWTHEGRSKKPYSVLASTESVRAYSHPPGITMNGATAMQPFLTSEAELGVVPQGIPDVASNNDAVLLRRIACADQNAMRVLFSNHRIAIYRFALRFLHDRALAEDVTSEVFLEVWRNASRFEGRSTVLTWILAIARHKALSARRFEPVEIENKVESNAEVPEELDAALLERDRACVLRRCIGKLSDEHREIIDLVYYQDQPLTSIASTLGIPHNTAKTRVFYARKRLADELKTEGMDWAVL